MINPQLPQPNWWLIALFGTLWVLFVGGVLYAVFSVFTNGHFSGTMGGS